MIHNPYKKTRLALFSFLLLLSYCFVIYRLYYIQIFSYLFYKDLAHKQTALFVSQYPPRADIFDRNGISLATNKDCLSAFIIPRELTENQIFELKKIISLDSFMKKKNNNFFYIARNISKEQKKYFEQFSFIHFLYEKGRYYPHKSCAGLVGITNIDNCGIAGLEYSFDLQLKGVATDYIIQKDARMESFYIKKELLNQGRTPLPVMVTVDSTLQFLTERIMQLGMDQWGCSEASAIIANPSTGEIIAIVSLPSYDPNNTITFDSDRAKLYGVTNVYEFGSVNKVFVALAALEEKIVEFDTPIDCKNRTNAIIDQRPINTWKACGVIPFWQVIASSNNIGIALVAKQLQDKLYFHYCALGFGKKPDIPLPGVAKGFVNHPNNWSKQSLISLSYGYEIASSLLQLTQAFCIIANDGIFIPLSIIQNKSQSILGKRKYQSETVTTLKKILEYTTQEGTAYRARINDYRIMTKTGSAHLLVDHEYSENHNIYSCAGIIEKDDYQRVITLYLKKEGEGQKKLWASMIAVPLFHQIAEKLLLHERII